jgi:catechol 2,3-dioxygenase-like lactoylglutathione lyase family enzyme
MKLKEWLLILAALVLAGRSSPQAEDERAHFHHVHLNVTNPEKSIQFYTSVFGATPTKFQGVSDALFTERSFILLNKVEVPPPSELRSGIWHIGWGGVDVANEYEWLKKKGVTFHTPLTPLRGPDNYYMYISGPDKELVEINTWGITASLTFTCLRMTSTRRRPGTPTTWGFRYELGRCRSPKTWSPPAESGPTPSAAIM